MYVVATAGHVDHGKSTLVRALTGMEPDRWAQERRRGMTIDLGYAWMTLPPAAPGMPGEQFAFVDVPGHERFVPNMLAGLGPVPAVLFVVAADGGWMPQSAEHLAAVHALGVRRGLLAVTRSDLADPGPATRRARAEIARTSLGAVEAVPVSAVTGQGLDELRAALGRLAATLSDDTARAAAGGAGSPVRLWIDRSFTIRGAGTVVTGTLPAGTVRNGQELLLAPGERAVRVRGLETLGTPADAVTGVARVALNLRGVPADLPERGMALIEPGGWTLTSEIDVRITTAAGRPHPKFPPDLLLHIGSARTQARMRVLGTVAAQTADGEEAGEEAEEEGGGAPTAIYARLRLRNPLPLHAGDRVLLRDPGAEGLAIYGARVLDPFPPPLARRGAGAAAVRELGAYPDSPRAADLLRRHKLLRAPQLAAAGLTVSGAPGAPAPVAGDWLADPAHWAWLRAELPKAVAAFAARDPLAAGMPAEAARAALGLPDRDLVTALVGEDVVLDGAYLRIFAKRAPGQAGAAAGPGADAGAAKPAGQLPPRTAAGVRAVLDGLADDPFAAPDTERLRALGLDARALAAAARVGLLLRVADLVVLAPGADKEAARVLAELDQPFTTSQARQALRTSRRVAIPLLEYLDRTRVTERLPGDLRRLRSLPGRRHVARAVLREPLPRRSLTASRRPPGPRLTARGRSAADRGHRTVRLQERRVADPVPRQLRRDRRPPAGGDVLIRRTGAQRPAQVTLGAGEQAVADLPVGGEPDPVARAAERPGDRSDHADPGGAAVHEEGLGGGGAALPSGIVGQGELAGQRLEDLARRDHLGALPAVLGVERHLLDEPQLVPALQAVAQQARCLVVVQVAHQHRVDLDRRQPGRRRGRETGQHVGEPVPAGQLAEGLGPQRVQRDVDPVEARRPQGGGPPDEADPVGGERDLRARRQRGRRRDDRGEVAAEQRLAAGEADLADAEGLHADPDKPANLLARQHLRRGQPVEALGRHAVRAAQIAAIGEGDPQIRRYPPVGISEHSPSLRAECEGKK
jgi:selenocysteine-specific elongation factor